MGKDSERGREMKEKALTISYNVRNFKTAFGLVLFFFARKKELY